MKIEAIAVGSHGVDLIPSDRHWECQHFSCRTTEMRDEWIRLINAGQAALECDKTKLGLDLIETALNDRWEQRRWELVVDELRRGYPNEMAIQRADALIAEFRKGEKP